MGSVPSSEIGNKISNTGILVLQSRFYYKWPAMDKNLCHQIIWRLSNNGKRPGMQSMGKSQNSSDQ